MHAIMKQYTSRLPLIVILGATASGKTKLSLDLAKRFSGEIISADSMQIYKNLDIISAKATLEERKIAAHHMIDKLQPHETCTVLDFRNEALQIIDKLFTQNKLPIIVGGTNYYIESLLWRVLISEPDEMPKIKPWEFRIKNPTASSVELHAKLRELDPAAANRLHPNNLRKIIRALEVLEEKGRKMSDILHEQQSHHGGNSQGGGLRYKNTIIFWLRWQQSNLDTRIDKRVDAMIEEGLINELLSFHKDYNNTRVNTDAPDYTTGIYQMIGLKEFHEYLMMMSNERDGATGRKAFDNGVEELKRVTRRYARKQVRWIKNRFLGRQDREVPPLYALNADDIEQWEENITRPAINIVESFITGAACAHTPEPKITVASAPNSLDATHVCEICQRTFVGQYQWQIHLQSRKHRLRKEKIGRVSIVPNTNENQMDLNIANE